MDKAQQFFESVFPQSNYRFLAVLLFFTLLGLVIPLFRPKWKAQRANLVLGIVIVALFLMVMAVGAANRWQWIIGLLPTLMVGYQLFFLWLYHPREINKRQGEENLEVPPYKPIPTQKLTPSEVKEQSYKRAQDTISNHFSLKTLFVRYGLPAVLLGITGIVELDILVNHKHFFSLAEFLSDQSLTRIMLGLKLGAIGAYIYVLLELGRRTFRHDITGASAMWCWVTLVLGPLLAATVAILWRVDTAPNSSWWGGGVILFFAGFAPRRIIAAIEQAALQLLQNGTPTVVATRLIPLSKIRGISPQIEERLGEEGIVDVNSLASSEPIRLVRNTSYDMRQILSWIDEAILLVTLPRSWEVLEDEGITGAMDLAWYYEKVIDEHGAIRTPIPDEMAALAVRAKISTDSLVATIQRLYEDTQVQYIWSLYNNFTEFSGDEPLAGNEKDQERAGIASIAAP